MANQKSKALVPAISPIEKAIVDSTQQIDFAAAASALKKKRQVADNKLKKNNIVTGATNYIPVLFVYANGANNWIQIPKTNAKKFGIVSAPEGTLDSSGLGVKHNKTKTIKISYGFKVVARTKGAGRAVKRGGSATQKQVRAWISLSIPMDASFIDAIAFVKTFPKPPGLLRYSPTKEFMFSYARTIGGAGAAR